MANTSATEMEPDVLLQAYITHIQAALRTKLREAANEQIEEAVIEATKSLKGKIESRYDVLRGETIINLSINGVRKDVI